MPGGFPVFGRSVYSPEVIVVLRWLRCRRSVAGFLLQKELDYLDGAVANPQRPFVAIVGGSKVSSKIGVIESLLEKADKVIIV